jgi:predicted ATP-dependent protease
MATKITKYNVPSFDFKFINKNKDQTLTLFELSSHERARAALEFGLSLHDLEFNIFVISENRTSRMHATMEYIKSYLETQPTPSDWVYLNNFAEPNRPKPYKLPTGTAKSFHDRVRATIGHIKKQLTKVLSSTEFLNKIKQEQYVLEKSIKGSMAKLKKSANAKGFDLQQTEDGSISIVRVVKEGQPTLDKLSLKEKAEMETIVGTIKDHLQDLNDEATSMTEQIIEHVRTIKKDAAHKIIKPYLNKLEKSYDDLPEILSWIKEMEKDMLDNVDLFLPLANNEEEEGPSRTVNTHNRYAVNVLIHHADNGKAKAYVESNPSYENLFGAIKYKTHESGGLTTDFTMIQPGSLHRANGSVLAIRAEDIATYPQVWHSLKAALRDKEINIEELHRANGIPLSEAPNPHPIPLDIKVVLIGAPHWYYTFFFNDPDFQSYFKIKADIDSVFPATKHNLSIFATLLRDECERATQLTPDKSAIGYLLGYGAREANHREKVSTKFEIFTDLLKEAARYSHNVKHKKITLAHVKCAIDEQEKRSARARDQLKEYLDDGMTLIQTRGKTVGQINGLTVQSNGIDSFGAPSRITARTYMGRRGIINIEQLIEMSGPIQQKGVLSLEGFLRGTFGQQFPLSFGASITFEQSYGGVEGDSASIAELIAVISSLSGIPVRQDLAITGSMNQMGNAQPIGGINEKVEGFYFACKQQGLTGKQGVVMPLVNAINLCLNPEVTKAIDEGMFYLWGVQTVAEALEILLDEKVGEDIFAENTEAAKKTIYGRVFHKLQYFDEELTRRSTSGGH